MEQASKISKIAKNLEELQGALYEVDFSGLKVADNINKKIEELKEEFNEFVNEHLFFQEFNLNPEDYTYDKVTKSIEYGLDHLLYKEVFDNIDINYYDDVKDFIESIQELDKQYCYIRAKIRELKDLFE